MRKNIFFLLLIVLIPLNVYAGEATNISKKATYTINNIATNKLVDNSYTSYITLKASHELKITAKEKIKHIYIIYELSGKKGQLVTDYETIKLGSNNFLHEYHELKEAVKTISIRYSESASISELYVYGEGDRPLDVQDWKVEDKTDLMIFSTHADDEVLFFAGIMPTYLAQGKKVHVVYLARHDIGKFKKTQRLHEQLNGLWTLGVTDYPTFGIIPDNYSKAAKLNETELKKTFEVAETQMKQAGFTDDDVIKFDVQAIRRYQPKVIVGHAEDGEYGHGQHLINIHTLKQAVVKAMDPNFKINGYNEPVNIYKFYVHLYDKDNWTIIDFDQPLDLYGGKTAYQMAREAFLKHVSQQKTRFPKWLTGAKGEFTSAKQIKTANPMYWGLYYSSVGEDINKNDLFENIPSEEIEEPTHEEIITTTSTTKATTRVTKKVEKKNDKKHNIEKIIVLMIIGVILLIFIFFYRAKK